MMFQNYPYGGYQPPQQRFNGSVPNYPTQIPMTQSLQQMPTQSGMMIHPVTSVQEASVFQIPFDGSTSWFYDTSADKLYSKTFDFGSGTAPVITYVREQPVATVQYATMEDIEALRKEIEGLKPRKAAKKNADEPDE